MGWTFQRKPADVRGYLDSLLTWSNDDGARRVLDSAIVARSEYYAAVEHVRPDGSREVWAAVFLVKFLPRAADGYTFGYKDMCESMGPCSERCPARILDLLTPLPPEEWNPCGTCEGSGVTTGPRWAAHAQGKPCFMCDGAGKFESHRGARKWRANCRARLEHAAAKPPLRNGLTYEVDDAPEHNGVRLDRVTVHDARRLRFYHPAVGVFRWSWIRRLNYRIAADPAPMVAA